MVHLGHHTPLLNEKWTSKFQSNHPSILDTHLRFFYIQITEANLFLKTFNGNEPIHSNLIVIKMIIFKLDAITNTQLLSLYF